MRKIKSVLIGISIGAICELVLCLLISMALFLPRKLKLYSPIKPDEISKIEITISYINNGYSDSKTIILTECSDLAQDILNLSVKPRYLRYVSSDETCISSILIFSKNNEFLQIDSSYISSDSFFVFKFHPEEKIHQLVINYLEKNNIEY